MTLIIKKTYTKYMEWNKPIQFISYENNYISSINKYFKIKSLFFVWGELRNSLTNLDDLFIVVVGISNYCQDRVPIKENFMKIHCKSRKSVWKKYSTVASSVQKKNKLNNYIIFLFIIKLLLITKNKTVFMIEYCTLEI